MVRRSEGCVLGIAVGYSLVAAGGRVRLLP